MKKVFQHLLVVLENQHDDELVLSKALMLAHQYRSKVTLFCSLYQSRSQADVCQQAAKYQQQLQQTLQAMGLVAEPVIEICWQQPARKKIEQLLADGDISLIIKRLQHKRSLLSWLIPDLEHYFISDCTLPVWLVKQAGNNTELSILACLDLGNNSEQQHSLNHDILTIGEQIVQQSTQQLHVLNCYQADDYSMSLPYDSNLGFAPLPDIQLQHTLKLKPYIEAHHLPADIIHLSEGLPDDEVPKAVLNYQCQLAIIGNAHQHEFSSVLFGNTAQYLSRHTPCDVLIIKQAD
ncbi:universal stress protein [Arsukibacterium indicum]|uniref:Universal stress protein n=1 Tax=Arsukibacterium indicum TaxID=2848612 RepID=A0ABS6MJW7_9GAMM|nr:universal stress protein [Arsukibacterium indicum]MBV2129102.1 universal stress protein [Arsukibacterium indicum]